MRTIHCTLAPKVKDTAVTLSGSIVNVRRETAYVSRGGKDPAVMAINMH